MSADVFPFPSDELTAAAAHPDVEDLVTALSPKSQLAYRRRLAIEAARDAAIPESERRGYPAAVRALGVTLSRCQQEDA